MNATNLDNLLEQGHHLLEKGQYEEGLKVFRQADSEFPSVAKVKYGLGLAHFRLEQHEESIKHLNLALQLQPIYPLALVIRGMAYKALKQNEQANADFEAVLAIEPQTNEDWRARGIAFDELEQSESALECYNKILEIEPKNHQIWHNKGLTLRDLQRFDEALSCFERALEILPDKFFAIRSSGDILFSLQRYQEAINSYDRALKIKQKDSLSIICQGLCLFFIGKIEKAIANYDKALKIKPDNFVTWFYKGGALEKLQQYEAALSCYEKTLAINPNFEAASQAKDETIAYIEDLRQRPYLIFLSEILQTIEGGADQEQIYTLLQQNLDKLDFNLAKTLQAWTDTTFPEMESQAKIVSIFYIGKFGYLLQKFPSGNREDNMEIAIAIYKMLLTFINKQDDSKNWAITQLHLGNFYQERIKGGKIENTEKAIASFEQALIVFTQQDSPVDWAGTYNNLGNAYKDRIKGDKADNLERAITSFEQALIVYTQQDSPVDWAVANNNLGVAYINRIKGDKADNLERAIASFEQALIIRTQQNVPVQWAMTQLNLGNAYSDRIKCDKGDNIETAISSYQQVLVIYTQQDFPVQWAAANNNLGAAYWDRIKGDRADNIETAIASFEQALIIRTQQDFPVDWAMTQLNMGNAYWNRIKGDRADNLEIAIACYERVLIISTQQDFPVDWAETHNNMGNAYNDRIKGDKADNLEITITAYKRTLVVYTRQDFPYKWAITHNNLGSVYKDRIKGDKANNIETAVFFCQRALTVFTQQDFPVNWANTKINLGNAYKDRIKGDKADNIETAIFSYERALIVFTQQDFPYKWAITHNNFGEVYKERIKGDKVDNLETAISSYRRALIVFTQQDFPFDCLRTAGNLGNLHFKEGNWQLAINAYAMAIEAVEQSREWASNDENKQEVISNAISVYQNIVQAFINLGQIDKAIEYVERGKARNLVELLATRDLYPNGNIPPEIIIRLDDLRQAAIAESRRLRQQGNSKGGFDSSSGDNRSLATGTFNRDAALDRTRLNRIRQELDNLIVEHISEKDPSFQLTQKVEPISFNKIREVLPSEQTVLVEWFIGNGILSVFIVTPQQSIPVHLGYTEEQLQALVDTANQYYGLYLQRDSQWRNNLPQLLTELAQNLQLEAIIDRLKQLVPDYNQLILVPHRWLHLLPIHALPLDDGKCLLDMFPNGVSYAPSVQLLELTQKQSKPQLANLFAVQDPTEDLDFTNIEVEAVRSKFRPNDDVLVNQQASKSALTKERLAKANLTHFSCHGYFNFENPELSALLLAGSKVEKEQQEEKGETTFLPSREGGSIDLEKCLTLGEIFGLDLRNCRLVTLSACETGITDFRSLSDEYIGLPSGFLYAGSPSVVSSLWTVSDLSTTFLMIKFYQNLQEIDSVAIALNQAQLWLRNLESEEFEEWSQEIPLTGEQRAYLDLSFMQDSRPFASPYHWGAFCAVGS